MWRPTLILCGRTLRSCKCKPAMRQCLDISSTSAHPFTSATFWVVCSKSESVSCCSKRRTREISRCICCIRCPEYCRSRPMIFVAVFSFFLRLAFSSLVSLRCWLAALACWFLPVSETASATAPRKGNRPVVRLMTLPCELAADGCMSFVMTRACNDAWRDASTQGKFICGCATTLMVAGGEL